MSGEIKLENVAVALKANVYFDGKVVSHSIEMPDGSKKTVGLIYAGTYTFNTGASERMTMIAGVAQARIKGQTAWATYSAGSFFDVPGNSSFEIAVEQGIAEYLCEFK